VGAVAPILDAQEEENQPTADGEAADSETDGDEQAGKKEEKGPSFIAIPIFITEPAVGYGLGGAVAHFHKKKQGGDSGAGSHPPVYSTETAANVGKHQKVPPTISGVAAAARSTAASEELRLNPVSADTQLRKAGADLRWITNAGEILCAIAGLSSPRRSGLFRSTECARSLASTSAVGVRSSLLPRDSPPRAVQIH
jgi:hypothetical protein